MARDTMRGLLERFAEGVCYSEIDIDRDVSDAICPFCTARTRLVPGAYRHVPHDATCLVTRARAVLAKSRPRKSRQPLTSRR